MNDKQNKEVKPMQGVSAQNKRGEWVPAIEEPYYLPPFWLGHVRCRCGEKFWSKKRYEEHYALEHILAL